MPMRPVGVSVLHVDDFGVARHHEFAAYSAARWRPFRDRDFPEAYETPGGYKAMNIMTMTGMALFIGFFILMLNQDIQRFIFGNW